MDSSDPISGSEKFKNLINDDIKLKTYAFLRFGPKM